MHTVNGEQSLSTQYVQIETADAAIMIHSNATTYKVWEGGFRIGKWFCRLS